MPKSKRLSIADTQKLDARKQSRCQACCTPADWQPLHDRILIRRFTEERRVGLIFIPDIAKDPRDAQKAVVIAVGPGKWRDGEFDAIVDIKPGDVIWFGRYVDWEKGEYAFIQQADIIGHDESVPLAAA